MTSDASAYLAAVKWADEAFSLTEFPKKVDLPQVAKVVKSQQGMKTSQNVDVSTPNQVLLWLKVVKKIEIIAQCIKFKECRGPTSSHVAIPYGPKLKIDDDYPGWFEILSEEGRSVPCLDSVSELAKRFPERCLVRENNVKAFNGKNQLVGNDSVTIPSEKSRFLSLGEELTLNKIEVFGNKRYLKCRTSLKGMQI